MVRKKKICLFIIVIFTIFLLSTNYLLGVLQTAENEVRTSGIAKIEEKIQNFVKTLPEIYRSKPLKADKNSSFELFLKNIDYSGINVRDLNLESVWKEANSQVSKDHLVNIRNADLGKTICAMKNAYIIRADTDSRGTQLKLLLTLRGGQQVVFKPKWYPIEKTIEGPVYAGKDRYGAEIFAFYLAALLEKPFVPITVDRDVSLKHDILPVATKRVLDTSFQTKDNRTCIYGKCFYCKKEDPVCDNNEFTITGAVIFNIKSTLSNYRSPWQRTYKKGRKAMWEEFPNTYCKTVRNKLSKSRIYDLIDTAIFDFLMQNGDRHHYETLDDQVILLDNGKGLGNPNKHHVDILAPLYQCCMLRRDTYKTLLGLTGGILTEKLKSIPNIHNVITENHLKAMDERLLIIFAAVEYCKHQKNTNR